MSLKENIKKLMQRQDLSTSECESAMQEILTSNNIEQIAAFLVLLHAKPETAAEMFGLISALRANMLNLTYSYPLLDIVGTGGDYANTINISTGAAIICASMGIKIAKHGNRSVSSLCGSADVLEALGINIYLNPEQVLNCIEKLGIGFCFAPMFHPAFRVLKTIRQNLGVSTSLNILGPLLNPALAKYYLIGVSNPKLVNLFAEILSMQSVQKALIFHSHGLDELSTLGTAHITEINADNIRTFTLNPQDFGFQLCKLQDLQGGNPKTNAEKLMRVFAGAQNPISDTLALNAGIAATIYGLTSDFDEGIQLAKTTMTSGKPLLLLNEWIKLSNSFTRQAQ